MDALSTNQECCFHLSVGVTVMRGGMWWNKSRSEIVKTNNELTTNQQKLHKAEKQKCSWILIIFYRLYVLYLVFCILCNFYLYCVRIIKFLLFVYTYGLYLSFQKLFFLKGHTHFFLQILRVGLVFRVHSFRSPLNLGCIQYYPKMGFLYLRRGGVMVFELVSVTRGFGSWFQLLWVLGAVSGIYLG